MTPSEEIREAATRGLRILQEGIHNTNAYDRTNFSDLRVFYTNLHYVAKQAERLEKALARIGVEFDEVDSEDEPTLADIEGYIDDISGVSIISRGPTSTSTILTTATVASEDLGASGITYEISVPGPTFVNGVQSEGRVDSDGNPLVPWGLNVPPIPEWITGDKSSPRLQDSVRPALRLSFKNKREV